MKDVATLLNAMREAGVVLDYALFGAAAQMRHTKPVAMFDADVLVAVPTPDRLDVLRLLHDFCARKLEHIDADSPANRPASRRAVLARLFHSVRAPTRQPGCPPKPRRRRAIQ